MLLGASPKACMPPADRDTLGLSAVGELLVELVAMPPLPTYRCVRNHRRARPYEIMGFRAMDVAKSYKSMGFDDIRGP